MNNETSTVDVSSTGSALFDPVSLKVAYFSQGETEQLLGFSPEIIDEIKKMGFMAHEDSPPILFTPNGAIVISQNKHGDDVNYVTKIRERIETEASNGDVSRLSGFRIVVTDKCNMACTYCFVDTNTGAADITMDELKSGFELLFNFNKGRSHLNYQWFGGEPLMRRDLLIEGDIMAREMAKPLGITLRPTIVTNGTILNDKILAHFKEFNYGVGVSLDGPPEVNSIERRFVSGNTTEKVLEANIKRLLDAGIHVGANVTPTAKNYHDLHETIDYVLGLGMRFIYVNSPIPIRKYWVDDGAKWAEVLFQSRLYALSKGAMLFSHMDRIYQAIDTRKLRVFEHLQSCGGLNAALLPGGKLSVLDLNWRNKDYVFKIEDIRQDPSILSKARKDLYPIKECNTCEAAGICGGPSVNDRLLIGHKEPLPQYCNFFKKALSLAVFDTTGLQ